LLLWWGPTLQLEPTFMTPLESLAERALACFKGFRRRFRRRRTGLVGPQKLHDAARFTRWSIPPKRIVRATWHWSPPNVLAVVATIAILGTAFAFEIWSLGPPIDPPRQVNELHGSVLASASRDGRFARSYWMLVRTDDGRTVVVSNFRRVPPHLGERVTMQETNGWFSEIR
jgi:hypothetical protein